MQTTLQFQVALMTIIFKIRRRYLQILNEIQFELEISI